jgi:hypothetical protein
VLEATYRTIDNKYLIITHSLPFSASEGNRILEGCSDGTCIVQSWIDIEKGYFARSTVVTGEQLGSGGKPQLEASQSFSCFDDDIRIEPPAWLNAEPDAEGQLMVTNPQVLIVPHHELPAQ